tara:strand:- start:442 stop:1125 length:684 start_codon:yes stop_codon:yes gene_type:complete
MVNTILYFGRKNCKYSKKLKNLLKRKSKKFYYIENTKRDGKFPIKKYLNKNYSYIICYRNLYILKDQLIKKAKIAAINFHPGTPNYRGIGCVNYALYENAKYFGSTCHLMTKKIDQGDILNVQKFIIKKNDTIESTLKKTHKVMFAQAKFILNYLFKDEGNLAKLIKKNKSIKWSKKIKKRKDLEKFYQIKINSSKKELKNKIRATNTKFFKPYVNLHNKRFVYSTN